MSAGGGSAGSASTDASRYGPAWFRKGMAGLGLAYVLAWGLTAVVGRSQVEASVRRELFPDDPEGSRSVAELVTLTPFPFLVRVELRWRSIETQGDWGYEGSRAWLLGWVTEP